MIPQAFNGFAHTLVLLTALEFIQAQASRTMQGFLIGVWYAMQSVNVKITIAGYISCTVFYWQYYASKTLLVFLYLALCVIEVARKYKYLINIQPEIEDVFVDLLWCGELS